MSAERLTAAIADRFPDADASVDAFGVVLADVPPDTWVEAATFVRDLGGCTYFDWLSAVDELDAGFAVVLHVYSVTDRVHVRLRTRVSKDAAVLTTLTGVYRGASWHERETAEMFGIVFAGHPNPKPLLLPPEFEGHPLRKDFVLASRVAKTWPGAKEPGESEHGPGGDSGGGGGGGAPSRRRVRPPGKPDVDEWREMHGGGGR
ncbi:MAG TPA: NADH-quinone oxidoreductase subunit C [Streptosporangiales bacterium]